MRSKLVRRYFCGHCPRGFWKTAPCANHERRCFFNPKREPFDGELYPMPKGGLSRQYGAESEREKLRPVAGEVAWPAVKTWDELGPEEMHPMAGWEPIDEADSDWDDAPHVYLEGAWHPISSEVWSEEAANGNGLGRLELADGVPAFPAPPAASVPDPDFEDIPF